LRAEVIFHLENGFNINQRKGLVQRETLLEVASEKKTPGACVIKLFMTVSYEFLQ
jgi:hypothetical protein